MFSRLFEHLDEPPFVEPILLNEQKPGSGTALIVGLLPEPGGGVVVVSRRGFGFGWARRRRRGLGWIRRRSGGIGWVRRRRRGPEWVRRRNWDRILSSGLEWTRRRSRGPCRARRRSRRIGRARRRSHDPEWVRRRNWDRVLIRRRTGIARRQHRDRRRDGEPEPSSHLPSPEAAMETCPSLRPGHAVLRRSPTRPTDRETPPLERRFGFS